MIEDFNFLQDVSSELRSARKAHGRIHSAHEGYAVILEELDEFWEEVRRKRADRSASAMRLELIQIAAMAARTAVDVLR